MVRGISAQYERLSEKVLFLHILLMLTVIGCLMNTGLWAPSKDKYYALFLLRMDAREYTLVTYGCDSIKAVIGFLPFTLLFGRGRGIPMWFCILLPSYIVGLKMFAVAVSLWNYEKSGRIYNENNLSGYHWGAVGILLAAAYGLLYLGFILPANAAVILFLADIPLGMIGLAKLLTFQEYRAVSKELLSGVLN